MTGRRLLSFSAENEMQVMNTHKRMRKRMTTREFTSLRGLAQVEG